MVELGAKSTGMGVASTGTKQINNGNNADTIKLQWFGDSLQFQEKILLMAACFCNVSARAGMAQPRAMRVLYSRTPCRAVSGFSRRKLSRALSRSSGEARPAVRSTTRCLTV